MVVVVCHTTTTKKGVRTSLVKTLRTLRTLRTLTGHENDCFT